MKNNASTETATLAGGCFWCTEALFTRLKGVISVMPGYAGGTVPNPTYDEVCSGTTGHAESIQIVFDPKELSFEKILDVFFHTHDPTTRNRQGNDSGPQYRSVVFYHDEEQKKSAEAMVRRLSESHTYPGPIVTEILPFTGFYVAEDYHRRYYEKNKGQPYCQYIIDPKIDKLMEHYRADVKPEYRQ